MDNQKINVSFGSGGILFTLFIVFLILKLVGVITWSWWLVCLPLLIYAGIIVFALLLMLILFIIAAIGSIWG